jgi:Gpi18-like mannosyltransferase
VQAKIKEFLLVGLLTLVPTLLVWLPFFLRIPNFWGIPLSDGGMATIVENYDGPLYLIVAKTFYNAAQIKGDFQFALPTEYYAAHFPLFPVFIRLFSVVAGYPYAMLMVTIASSFLALFFFNKLLKLYVSEKDALFLTLVFSVFPARWLVVRSVGSADPLFLAGVTASIYYFIQKKYFWAGIWGAIAQLTKSPAILLFVSYFVVIIAPYIKTVFSPSSNKLLKNIESGKILSVFLIPLALILVFTIYYFTYGNFLAYFNSGDNIHLFFPPFQIFNYSLPWVGTFWQEEIIFIYLFGILGVLTLIKQRRFDLAVFTGIFWLTTIFISHRDLVRYSLPLVPFIFVAFSDYLVKKEFKIALIFLILPIYLFSLAFISQNVMPISNWAPFL